ncbi:MAG: RNA polymerase sigma factor [Acidimicrobiia bacterium]
MGRLLFDDKRLEQRRLFGVHRIGSSASSASKAPPGRIVLPKSENAERFESLFHETYPSVLAYCRRRCESLEDAEDAVAATYLVAWRRMADFEAADSTLAWLYAVAYKSLSNVRRGRDRLAALRRRLRRSVSAHPTSPERQANSRLDLVRAFDSLERLSRYHQEIVRLAAFENLSYREIAEVVGKSESAVRSDLYRARNRLRGLFHSHERRGDEKIT